MEVWRADIITVADDLRELMQQFGIESCMQPACGSQVSWVHTTPSSHLTGLPLQIPP